MNRFIINLRSVDNCPSSQSIKRDGHALPAVSESVPYFHVPSRFLGNMGQPLEYGGVGSVDGEDEYEIVGEAEVCTNSAESTGRVAAGVSSTQGEVHDVRLCLCFACAPVDFLLEPSRCVHPFEARECLGTCFADSHGHWVWEYVLCHISISCQGWVSTYSCVIILERGNIIPGYDTVCAIVHTELRLWSCHRTV